jgi:hypothetical protein
VRDPARHQPDSTIHHAEADDFPGDGFPATSAIGRREQVSGYGRETT